ACQRETVAALVTTGDYSIASPPHLCSRQRSAVQPSHRDNQSSARQRGRDVGGAAQKPACEVEAIRAGAGVGKPGERHALALPAVSGGDTFMMTAASNSATTKQPLVSVVVLHYKRRDALDEVIRSLRAQDYENFEAIIVDNHSQDGVAGMVASLDSRF